VLIKDDATNLNTGGGNHRVYVFVTAVDDQGSNVTKTTNTAATNDTDNDWNRTPRGISLSKWNYYFIDSHTSQTSVEMEADSGYLLLDYHFEAE
jgi:hypothetical protein